MKEICRSGAFQPSSLAKSFDCFFMTGLILESARQKVIAASRWRLLQQRLESNDSIDSSGRDLEQTPGALELNVRIIWSGSESSLI